MMVSFSSRTPQDSLRSFKPTHLVFQTVGLRTHDILTTQWLDCVKIVEAIARVALTKMGAKVAGLVLLATDTHSFLFPLLPIPHFINAKVIFKFY